MKANELMIGDWVLVNGTPMQIQAINDIDDEIMADDELYCLIEDRIHSEDKIEPIPLTKDILEKNGWKEAFFSGGYGRKGMRLDGIPYTTGLPKGVDNALNFAEWSIDENFEFHLLVIYMWKGNIRLWVNYVHELQHAFRLCGITHEIVL